MLSYLLLYVIECYPNILVIIIIINISDWQLHVLYRRYFETDFRDA